MRRALLAALSAGALASAAVGATEPAPQTAVTTSSGAGAVTSTAGTIVGPIRLVVPKGLEVKTRTSHEPYVRPSPTPRLSTMTPTGTPVALKVDAELENALRNGEDLILDRQYDQALALFETVSKTHPDSPLGPLGKVLVYQSQMLENGDFKEEADYDQAILACGDKVKAALAAPGGKDDVWTRMMAGGYYGVRGMHAMRKKSYIKAIDWGWDALDEIKTMKKLEPGLKDTDLGLGVYDYWRSVITKNVSWLPFFPDKRASGIKAVEGSYVESQYVRAIAELVLVFIYNDEHRYEGAVDLGEDMAKRYPNNTLVRIQLGRAYSFLGRYNDALATFHEVERLQPDNVIVGYYIGANLMYQGKDLDGAEDHLRAFLPKAPGDDWKGWAYERLGDVYMKRKNPQVAIVYWEKAEKLNPNDDSLPKKVEFAKKQKVAAVASPTPGQGMGSLP